MMQMLEAGGVPALTDHVRARDDDNPRGYFELEAVKRTKRDSAWLEVASGRAVKMVHLLLYDLRVASEMIATIFRFMILVDSLAGVGTTRRGSAGRGPVYRVRPPHPAVFHRPNATGPSGESALKAALPGGRAVGR